MAGVLALMLACSLYWCWCWWRSSCVRVFVRSCPRASALLCVRAFLCSCVRVFLCSCIRAFMHSSPCVRASVHSCVRVFVRSCVRAFVRSCICPRASMHSCVRAFVCSCARAFVRSCARASVRLCVRAALCSYVRPFVAVFVGVGGGTAAAVHLFVPCSSWSVVGLLFLLSFVCPWLYSPVWNPFVSCTCRPVPAGVAGALIVEWDDGDVAAARIASSQSGARVVVVATTRVSRSWHQRQRCQH